MLERRFRLSHIMSPSKPIGTHPLGKRSFNPGASSILGGISLGALSGARRLQSQMMILTIAVIGSVR